MWETVCKVWAANRMLQMQRMHVPGHADCFLEDTQLSMCCDSTVSFLTRWNVFIYLNVFLHSSILDPSSSSFFKCECCSSAHSLVCTDTWLGTSFHPAFACDKWGSSPLDFTHCQYRMDQNALQVWRGKKLKQTAKAPCWMKRCVATERTTRGWQRTTNKTLNW